MKNIGGVFIFLTYTLSPQLDKPLKSVTHGQCDARPTVTFPVAGHRCPATGTKLYCLVTEAHGCEQLAHGRYLTSARPGVELATSRVASQRLNRYATRPHKKLIDPTPVSRILYRVNANVACNLPREIELGGPG